MNIETHSQSHMPTWCPLPEYTFIKIQGSDAETFLQGQCTNDFITLATGEAGFGAHCNPKGRMISSFLALKLSPDTFILRLHSSLIDIASTALKKYMVFSKSSLNPASSIQAIGLTGANTQELSARLQKKQLIIHAHHHSDTATEIWINRDNYETAIKTLSVSESASHIWTQTLFALGIAEVQAEHSERYLPQELNFDRISAVNFKKGCYTGQEVIARLHYRGKMKKHLYYGTANENIHHDTSEQCKITNNNTDKNCGVITHSCQLDTHTYAILALVEDEAITQNNCSLTDNKQVKIQWLPLPYAIP